MEVTLAILAILKCTQRRTVVQSATNYGKQRGRLTDTKKLAKRQYATCPLGVFTKYHKPFLHDLLEDEGIVISEELKYFPYRATFDFECYFKKVNQHPRNTAKLT